jgi:hypothetical protein
VPDVPEGEDRFVDSPLFVWSLGQVRLGSSSAAPNLSDLLLLFNLLDVFMKYGIVLKIVGFGKLRSSRRF